MAYSTDTVTICGSIACVITASLGNVRCQMESFGLICIFQCTPRLRTAI
jgi:hypothetical protein